MSGARTVVADVAVIGAGPAGLSAAVTAARHGRRVILLDQGIRPGGQIWHHRHARHLSAGARRLIDEAARTTTVLSGARVIDARGAFELLIESTGDVTTVRADTLVLATGARERFLPFPGWTLSGVVGVGGLQALIKSGVSVAGARIVIAGTGPLLFPVAATAARAGAHVLLVGEQASRGAMVRFGLSLWHKPRAWWQAAAYRAAFARTPLRYQSWPVRATGTSRIEDVELQVGCERRTLRCDWLATAAGLVPNIELAQLLGCRIAAGAISVDAAQRTSLTNVWAAGECTAVKGDEAAIAEGVIAGAAAAGDPVPGVELRRTVARGRRFGEQLASTFAPRPELCALAGPDTVLCRCEDIHRRDIDPAWSQRQAKLWTRIGMGECQGAVCGPACAALFGWNANATRAPLGSPTCGGWLAALEATAGRGNT